MTKPLPGREGSREAVSWHVVLSSDEFTSGAAGPENIGEVLNASERVVAIA
jgi:hypothetical protein